MNTVIIALLLIGVCLALIIGLMTALQKAKSNPLQQQADSLRRGPEFRDHSAGEYSGDQQSSRSQFAWQSRSHSRPPD
jgi:outer membrane biogenesis lipoprotein LolB